MADIRDAIAVMTAWLSEPDGGNFVGETMMRVVEDRSPEDPTEGLIHLVKGLAGFCGFLLARREKETGTTMQSTLGEFGRDLAGE